MSFRRQDFWQFGRLFEGGNDLKCTQFVNKIISTKRDHLQFVVERYNVIDWDNIDVLKQHSYFRHSPGHEVQ